MKKALRLHLQGHCPDNDKNNAISSVRNNHVMVMRSSEADNMTGEAATVKRKII
ncbi:MAG: hypothetical protein ACLT33_10565 [Lachnospira pectinoschiza]